MSKERGLMGRREFLVLSSTVAAAAVAVGPTKVFAGEMAPPKRLAVGYVPADDGAALAAASSIPSGDGRFIRTGARVTVSGASGADPRHRRAVDLLVNYSYWDGAQRRQAPFRAWACTQNSECQGNRVNFTVPVDEVQKIRFAVGVERPTAGIAKRAGQETAESLGDGALPVTLSLLSDPASIKLVRGFYVIVPLFDGDDEPRWSAYTLQQREGRWALYGRDGNVAPFEHFVLRVDYA